VIVSINQPAYLPWLGYFDRILKSDLHIVLDNVQIEHNTKTSFTNRNKIRTSQGWCWLTIPIKHPKSTSDALINNVLIESLHWRKKHYRSIVQSYGKTEFFKEHEQWLDLFYKNEWGKLIFYIKESTNYFLEYLGIDTPIIYSSELDVEGKKDDLVLNLCKHVGANTYLSGPFGKDYIGIDKFEKDNINVVFEEYNHPTYSQIHGDFIPYMSIIDVIFNNGNKVKSFLNF
jgi:WbqC-like protein family